MKHAGGCSYRQRPTAYFDLTTVELREVERLQQELLDCIKVLDWATGEGYDNPHLPDVVNAYLDSARKRAGLVEADA
jgi:hypothetical protein